MDERTELMKRIAELKKELAALSTPKNPKAHRTSKNPRSPLYVVDYDRLTKVSGGYVDPEILAMYNKPNYQ
jgi:hypothetical protein